jgi:hypothetical protein
MAAQTKAANEINAAIVGKKSEGGLIDLDSIGGAFDEATASGDTARAEYIKHFLAGNKDIEQGFFSLTEKGMGGAEHLREVLKSVDMVAAKELGDVLKTMRARVESPKGMPLTMNVTMHQDFKDQDPDRIAMLIRDDLMKHAVDKLAAVGADVFGW